MSSKQDQVDVPCPNCGATPTKLIKVRPADAFGGERKQFLFECPHCDYLFRKEIGPKSGGTTGA